MIEAVSDLRTIEVLDLNGRSINVNAIRSGNAIRLSFEAPAGVYVVGLGMGE